MKEKFKFSKAMLLIALTFVTTIYAQLPNGVVPGSNWSDSYSANGLCWCETTYDHDLDDITKVWFVINGERRNIRDICEELENHPSFRNKQNSDLVYNDIQCGNGPANTAKDETYCPGRVGISSTDYDDLNEACQTKGPTWDLAWLASRDRFDGEEEENQLIANGTYYLASPYLNQNLVSTSSINHNAEMDDAANVAQQQWTFSHQGNNIYTIKNNNTNRFLEVPQENCYNNANVGTWVSANDSHQKWKISKNGSLYILKATHCSTNVLDREKGATDANVSIYPYSTSNNNQKWQITKNTDTLNPTGIRTVSIMGETINKYVTVQGNSSNSISCNSASVTTSSIFTMEQLANGKYTFKGNNGKYISSEYGRKSTTCNRDTVGNWEQFTLTNLGGDVYAIYSDFGGYLAHERGIKAMNCNRPAIGTWERFVIKDVLGGSKAAAPTIEAVSSFTAFPNPIAANDILSVQLNLTSATDIVIQLITITGKQIAQQDFGQLQTGQNFIELSQLQEAVTGTGIFILSIQSGLHTVNERIVFTK